MRKAVAFLCVLHHAALLATPVDCLRLLTWSAGGGLTIQFRSPVPFDVTKEDAITLAAHLPGFRAATPDPARAPDLLVDHRPSAPDAIALEQGPGKITVSAPWEGRLPPDFVHLLYGATRREWLERGIYPVHAACVGNDRDGYALLVGAPGSGKTSLTLYGATNHGLKVFSGDKTLLWITPEGKLHAIAGTHTLTVRDEDIPLWTGVDKVDAHQFGDRLAFRLPPDKYAAGKTVPIKRIFFVGVTDGGKESHSQLTPLSALHTLYPFFMDKQREDILVGGGQAIFDGSTGNAVKARLSQGLETALKDIPVYKISAPLGHAAAFIDGKLRNDGTPRPPQPKKILYGICGIGNGHFSRQLPVLQHLLDEGHEVVLFAYGDSLDFFRQRFPKRKNLTVLQVANPYWVGKRDGLDFDTTASHEKNQADFNRINALAMSHAAMIFGTPDLVISDYEQVSAQYAYAKRAPLVTFDQQSKYLVGTFPQPLGGTTYADEIERLSMFFPLAAKRLAVSFFQVPVVAGTSPHKVDIFAPVIRPVILAAKPAKKSERPSVVVYVTAQQLEKRPVNEWMKVLESSLPKHVDAHIFLPAKLPLPVDNGNLHFYRHGDPRFDSLFIASHGVISTAGHTLLSEAMYLEKPVYALPLPLYEQQLNAHVIAQGGFGISEPTLTPDGVMRFLSNLDEYEVNIRKDRQFLIKEPSNERLIEEVERVLNGGN